MKSAWLRNCKDDEQRQDVREALKDGRRALELLKEIIKNRIEASHSDQRARAQYDDVNWALKQADFIGCQRTYKEILDLIDNTQG